MTRKSYRCRITTSAIVDIDGVGPVLFELSTRAKRVSISVKPFAGVRVAVPRGSSFDKARRFIEAQTGWVRKHLDKIKSVEQEHKDLAEKPAVIDRTAAREQLCGRLKELAEVHGFIYSRVCIRNQRTRWGSCSADNNISLNMKLVTLPQELRDYVILHELVHTREKNHGRPFWVEMNRLVGNGKRLQSRLKTYGLGLP